MLYVQDKLVVDKSAGYHLISETAGFQLGTNVVVI